MIYSIVYRSEVGRANRFDADYFKPEYLELEKKLEKTRYNFLKDLSEKPKYGTTPEGGIFEKEGIPFLRSQDFKQFFVNLDDVNFCKKEFHKKNKKSNVIYKDILIACVGATVGEIGFYLETKEANTNQNIGRIRAKNINAFYLFVYFLSYFGNSQLRRLNTGDVKEYLNSSQLEKIKVSLFSDIFEREIESIVKEAYEKQNQAKELYKQSEAILLEELGLLGYEPKNRLSFETTKREVDQAKRFDADYFQPKYTEIIRKIEGYKGGFEYLENLTTYINHGNQPPYVDKGEIKFFSQKWIKDKFIDYSFLESNEEPMVSKEFFREEKNKLSLVNKGDILYYSVGANLGYCHNYLEDKTIAAGSFINIIRADRGKTNDLFLGFIMNSIIGRLQGDQQKSGLAQPYIYPKNLRRFKIPLISPSIQEEIAENIIKSHRLRKQSKALLTKAKEAVEFAIEEGEVPSLALIRNSRNES